MQQKIETTLKQIKLALNRCKRPAVLWSGGKDSNVMLWLVRQVEPRVDCILWTLPWMKGKYLFHAKMAAELRLNVYDGLPMSIGLNIKNNRVDFNETYSIGKQAIAVGRGTEKYEEGEDFVCGVDWLNRPKAVQSEFPWDVLFCGHKSSDVDPTNGPVPLSVDMLSNEGCADIWYPLRDWTDKDITEYTLENNIPIDTGRYEIVDGVITTRANKICNSDYHHACTNCIDPRNPKFVRCPKLDNVEIKNISDRVNQCQPVLEYCSMNTKKD